MGGFIWKQSGTHSLRPFHASMQQLTNICTVAQKKIKNDQLINFHYAELHSSFRYLSQNTETRPLCYFQPCYVFVLFFSSCTFPTGSSLKDKVSQSSADMFSSAGGTVNISCLHNIPNYDLIYWYKKSKRELQLLGYMNFNTGYPQDGLGVTIGGSAREGQTCTLTAEGLTVNSSAVYFCAASLHTDEYHCSSVQKPHHNSPQLGTSHGRGAGSIFSLRVDVSQNVSLSSACRNMSLDNYDSTLLIASL